MKRKTSLQLFIPVVLLLAGLTLTFAFTNVKHAPKKTAATTIQTPPGPGIPKNAIAGSDIYDSTNSYKIYNCGDPIIVFVADASSNLTTGTVIYTDSHLIHFFPQGIITSATSPTSGSSFFVQALTGLILGTATPC